MSKIKISKLKLLFMGATLLAANIGFVAPMIANATTLTLTNATVRLSHLKAGTDSTVRVLFKTTTNAGATGLTVDFTAAWTTNSGTINGTQAISGVAGCDASATALPGGSLSASGSGHIITVTNVTALSASTLYCFDLTTSNAVHTPTAGNYLPVITETGGATDSTTVNVDVISNDSVVVNATVPPTFTFALASGCASNQDNFTAGLATSGTNTTGGCTWQVDTNAKTGWFAWASDSQTGLHSTAVSKTIASSSSNANTTISNGTEGYVMGVTSVTQGTGAGVVSASNPFGNNSGGTAGSYQGSGLRSTADLIASSTGTASAAQFVTKEYATINALTPAANDYTDTITIIAAGSF